VAVPIGLTYELRLADGVTALNEDRCEEAREIFLDLVDSDAEDTGALYGLGVAEMCLGQLDPAIGRFRDYATRMPDDPDGHAMLAYCLWLAERDAEARQPLQRALEIDPGVLERLDIEELSVIGP